MLTNSHGDLNLEAGTVVHKPGHSLAVAWGQAAVVVHFCATVTRSGNSGIGLLVGVAAMQDDGPGTAWMLSLGDGRLVTLPSCRRPEDWQEAALVPDWSPVDGVDGIAVEVYATCADGLWFRLSLPRAILSGWRRATGVEELPTRIGPCVGCLRGGDSLAVCSLPTQDPTRTPIQRFVSWIGFGRRPRPYGAVGREDGQPNKAAIVALEDYFLAFLEASGATVRAAPGPSPFITMDVHHRIWLYCSEGGVLISGRAIPRKACAPLTPFEMLRVNASVTAAIQLASGRTLPPAARSAIVAGAMPAVLDLDVKTEADDAADGAQRNGCCLSLPLVPMSGPPVTGHALSLLREVGRA